MNLSQTFTRRLALAAAVLLTVPIARAAQIPESCKIGGFFVGTQAYTFNHFSVMEAIEKTAQAGGKTIEFYPGQRLSPDQPRTVTWDHKASDANIQKVKDQLAKFHIVAISYGVVGPARAGDEVEWRKIFDFAKKLGLYSITTETVSDMDLIEKFVKEYDIKVGIHEHWNRDDANYKVWDPKYVLSIVKDRDPRIGACADTGHWASSGIVPLDGIKLLRGRLVNIHLKDRPEIGKRLPDTILGTGASNIKGILDELRAQGYPGPITLEYENNWDNSVPDVTKSIDFIRANSGGH